MMLSLPRVRHYLTNFELEKLLIEELGWDCHAASLNVAVGGETYTLRSLAEKRGVQIFQCKPDASGKIPDYDIRRKIEKQVTKSAYEHLIIFVDGNKATQIWQWVDRGLCRPAAYREHAFHPQHQSGDALIQKLNAIIIPLDEEEGLDLTGTVHKLRDAFDRDRVTKQFYDRFKKEHAGFLEFIQGITDQGDKEWYASLMLNRLMFVYFIQKEGFLDGNPRYLTDRLQKVQARKGKGKFLTFYRCFLVKLFHEGFYKRSAERQLDPDLKALLGDVPYLNGGLFELHELEQKYPNLDIPDEAFEKLFAFFDDWEWTLDTRPLRNDREINPDVLGYIFEKYINQKQMGAYYTKEDITGYISKNTIIPWLFDAAKKKCAVAFDPDSALWRLLRDDPDRCIYTPVRKGVTDEVSEVIPLPAEISAGLDNISQRGGWNRSADAEYALPTETWREHVARRRRCLELREKLLNGEIHEINDLITYNLDIRQFIEDVIAGSEGPELLRAFWQAIREVTVLDPTCGSGAFLFAALNILEPLYETCLDRMQAFVEDLDRSGERHSPKKFEDFRRVLAQIEQHPNRPYFISKSIIVGNLYGVDIMEEAVEICKLRLFLKLVAQVDRAQDLEPLPDIDFNIRAINTLVGFATLEEVKKTLEAGKFSFAKEEVDQIVEDAEIVERAFQKFHEMQTEYQMDAGEFAIAKQQLRQRLDRLADQLDSYLAGEYSVDPNKPEKFERWRSSHHPFHWFAEFYRIMHSGGFDTIIGNPPYVEYVKVRPFYTVKQYKTLSCGNLYVFLLERSQALLSQSGCLGLIMPLSLLCTERMTSARAILAYRNAWVPAFDMRPSSLFEGIAQRLCMLLQGPMPRDRSMLYTGGYRRWSSCERSHLIPLTYFVKFPWDASEQPIMKAMSQLDLSILHKISGPSIRGVADERADPIYVHRICRYFIKALDFVPYFRNADGEGGKSEDYKPFFFRSADSQNILCILNSSLFYWFWRCAGDGFHCGYGDVFRFPFRSSFDNEISKTLSILIRRLMQELKAGSQKRAITTIRGTIEYQEFYPSAAKHIMDDIDRAVAQHYQFDAAELDFIINYDIKYRMGADVEGDEE